MVLFGWLLSKMKQPVPVTKPLYKTRIEHMSADDIASRVKTFGNTLPSDAVIVEGISWNSESGVRCEKITAYTSEPPRQRIWYIEEVQGNVQITTRPATATELDGLIKILRDVGASEDEVKAPAAEAHFDCRKRSLELSFTALNEMTEGVPYKRWYVQYHSDGRPPSVLYFLETRRDDGFDTIFGSVVILRGKPWET